jgi:hypothetical protein
MTRVEHTTRGKGDKTMGEDGPPVSHYRNPGGGRSGMIYKFVFTCLEIIFFYSFR